MTDLQTQLREGDEETRKQAAATLRDAPDAAPALVEALHDPARSVRRAAHESLIALRDKRAVEPLIAAAADGRLDFNAVAYSLENKFGVEDAYPRTMEAVTEAGDEALIATADEAYRHWEKRQKP